MITSELAKFHLKLDETDQSEDIYINLLVEAATKYVTSITKVQNDIDVPETYKIAVLLLIAHWHANREAVSEGMLNKVPYGFSMLVDSLRPSRGLF